MKNDNFWEAKTLDRLSNEEWESLCDGCGRCCLNKIEDDDTGEYFYTNVACSLLDLQTCRCSNYNERNKLKQDCFMLSPENISEISWLPETCAYRLLAEGKPLDWWHPLVSGDPSTVRQAGKSLLGYVISEDHIHDDNLSDHVINWVNV